MQISWLTVCVFLCGTAVRLTAATAATGPSTKPTAESTADPRPGLVAFYDAVRHGDEAKAFGCWCDDVEGDDSRKQVEDLTTKDLLAGKFKNAEDMELGFLKHMSEIADAEDKAGKPATTQSNPGPNK